MKCRAMSRMEKRIHLGVIMQIGVTPLALKRNTQQQQHQSRYVTAMTAHIGLKKKTLNLQHNVSVTLTRMGKRKRMQKG